MRILQLSSESSWRGGEQQIAYLVEELAKKNISPIIAGREASKFSEYAADSKWQYLNLGMKNSLDFRSALLLKKICKEKTIDILHAHSSRSHSIAHLASLLGNNKPIVVSRRVDFPPKDNVISRHKYNMANVKRIACVSKAIENMISPILTNQEKCTTIYSGIDHSKFSETLASEWLRKKYELDKDTILIGNTSAIAPHKDYFTFVDTAEHFIKNNENIKVKFFIIGTGPMEQEIKGYVARKKMQSDIVFTGFLDNMTEVLPSLDIFFISSETEGLGTSILDAFACKVPVVATEAGGIPEIVINEKTGLTAAVKDAEALSNQLQMLIKNDTLRIQLTLAAHEKALAMSKEKMAAQYFDMYEEILYAG